MTFILWPWRRWNARAAQRGGIALALAALLSAPTVLGSGDGNTPGVLDLSGTWLVHHGDGSEWAAPSFDDRSWTPVALPATWEQLETGGEGPLWLRRHLELGEGWARRLAPDGLAVWIGAASYRRYELYANGRQVGAHGAPNLLLPLPRARVFALPGDVIDEQGHLTLALRLERVAWMPDSAAQSTFPNSAAPRLGDHRTLAIATEVERSTQLYDQFAVLILFFLFFGVGVAYLVLYYHRRRQVAYLWFGLIALVYAAATFIIYCGPELTLRFGLLSRAINFCFHLSLALLIQFLWPFLGRPIDRLLRTYQSSQLALAAFSLLTPSLQWLLATNGLRWIWILPFLAAATWLLLREARRGNGEARTIGSGVLAVVLATFVELIHQVFRLGSTFPWPLWAFALFVLSMAASVTRRTQRMDDELSALRRRLEHMVADRTAELSTTQKRLQAEDFERRMAADALRMLERALAQSSDGVAVADRRNRLLYVNPAWAEMHGYSEHELVDKSIRLFHTCTQMRDEIEPLLARLDANEAHLGELEHRRKDGTTFPTWVSATALRDETGHAMGFIFIARDITARKRAAAKKLRLEARARHGETLRSQAELAARIAHDYNNLLTGVLGTAELVRRALPTGTPLEGRLAQIEAAVERAAQLSDQLLSFPGGATTLTTTNEAPAHQHHAGTILVVDDEDMVREVVQGVLEEHTFSVVAVDSGEKAVEVYAQRGTEIAVVLLDLTMPGMDGIATFRAIKRIDAEARILLMSGYRGNVAVEALTPEGLAGFLQKPFRPAGLIRALEDAMAG